MSDDYSSTGSAGDRETRAADFLLRRRFWGWSAADDVELNLWLESSVTNQVTYLRLQAGATRLERLAALRPPNLVRTTPRKDGDRDHWWSARTLATIAASTLLVAALGLGVAKYLLQPSVHALATEVGGHALLKFADGTQVELNTDTAVRYSMTTAKRIVWLDRGEAFFTVAHDAAHPFVVVVGDQRITDLGTQFLVRNDMNRTEVALFAGRAELASIHAPPRDLNPGDDAVATPVSLMVVRKTPQQLSDARAWQHGELVFRNTSLGTAVQEFNRYNRTKLEIDDPAVAALTIGGEFKANNVNDFLRLAQAVLRLRAGRSGDDIVIFRDKPDGEVKDGH